MNKGENLNYSKLNKIMQEFPRGLVLLSSWLVSEGYSYELQQRYRKSGWLKSIGTGAMLKSNDSLLLSGALAALQVQVNIPIHIGGRSALELNGSTHYLQLSSPELTLFTSGKIKLPSSNPKSDGLRTARAHEQTHRQNGSSACFLKRHLGIPQP